MRLILGLTFIILLNSCSRDGRFDKYNKIIHDCDRVKIYTGTDNDFKLIREIVDEDDLSALKAILKRNINPEMPGKFMVDKRFEILKGDKVVGRLLITESNERPFVNFVSADCEFGFELTYGIGTYLN